jgi:hypothetical protein
MEVTDVITLTVAVWGAFLATYQWWFAHRERRTALKVWSYWTSTFVARVQNVSSKPVKIAEITLHGRFLSGLPKRIFRVKDEEFVITHPVTDEGTPLILQPQESHTESFDNCWDHLEQYEINRLRDHADGGPERLAIRSLVVRIVDGEGRTCESEPYVLDEQPSPRHSDDGYAFAAPIRIPAAFGLRTTPILLRVFSRLIGRRGEITHLDTRPTAGDEGLATILDTDNDQVLCNNLCDSICQKEGFSINAVPSYERLVVISCTALRIIGEGGFANFFGSNFPGIRGYDDFPQAFNDIGSEQAASSIKQALSLFPEGEPQPDIEERRSYIERELSTEFEKLEGAIRNELGVHFKRLATYIRANADRFLRRR